MCLFALSVLLLQDSIPTANHNPIVNPARTARAVSAISISPGQRPGFHCFMWMSPSMGSTVLFLQFKGCDCSKRTVLRCCLFKAFALYIQQTQDVVLGCSVLPLRGVTFTVFFLS